MDSVCSNVIAREGIQTVAVENHCNFSRNSDLCICVVTWNMNGQVCLIIIIFTLEINVVISKGLYIYLPHFYVIFTCSPLFIMLFLLSSHKFVASLLWSIVEPKFWFGHEAWFAMMTFYVKVSYEDLVELIGSSRKFDLLIVGLQEVPRNNIARLLKRAVAETHE